MLLHRTTPGDSPSAMATEGDLVVTLEGPGPWELTEREVALVLLHLSDYFTTDAPKRARKPAADAAGE